MIKGTGILYVVATPIGNLNDISQRALETLAEVDLILCEDTRHWRKLAERHNLSTKCKSYHQHNEDGRTQEAITLLESGQNLALVSDAGTPCISDPGYRIVNEAIEQGFTVSPIPGASALIAALSASGLPLHEFQFLGFVPVKSGRRASFLKRALDSNMTTVVYESPYRILKTLDVLANEEPERTIFIARELTKKFEECINGSAQSIFDDFKNRPSIKGEFVLIISGLGKKANNKE